MKANGEPPTGAELPGPKALLVFSVVAPKLNAFVASVAFVPMLNDELLFPPEKGEGFAGAELNAATGAALNPKAGFGSAVVVVGAPNEGAGLSLKLNPDEKLPLPKAGGAVEAALLGFALNANGEGLLAAPKDGVL